MCKNEILYHLQSAFGLPSRLPEAEPERTGAQARTRVGFLAVEAATHASHYTTPHHGTARHPPSRPPPPASKTLPSPHPVLGFAPPRLVAPRRPRRSHGVVAPAQGGQPLQSHRRKNPTSPLRSSPILLESSYPDDPFPTNLPARGSVPLDLTSLRSEVLQGSV
jgi:hypothetical protein